MAVSPLTVTIRNRTKVLFQGQIKSLTSKNDVGIFDILPQHANFISLIYDRVMVQDNQGQKINFPIQSGVLKVWENQINIFLDIASINYS